MNPHQGFKVLPILLLVFMASVNSQITVQNAPPPTGSNVHTFKNAVNENRLIMSRRVENLESASLTQNSTLKTFFTLNSFNRGTIGNKDVYTLKLNGSWHHLKNSPESLSCNLILQKSTNIVGLLRFDIDNKSFKYLGGMPIASFTNATVDTALIDNIKQSLFIGEDCRVAGFTDRDLGFFTTYRANADWTNIEIISAIPIAYLQAKSNDMNYGVFNGSLYRYNPNTSKYDNVMTFPFYEKFSLVSSGKRLVVTGRVSSVLDSTTTPETKKVNYTIYVFNDAGSMNVVGKIPIVGAIERGNQLMLISTSPKLTKLGFGYQTQSGQVKIVAKHIDFSSNTIVDLVYEDPVKFAQTVMEMNAQTEMDLSDAFMIARNASQHAGNTAATCVQEAYQFVGSQVIKLNTRILDTDKEYYDFKKTRIDFGNSDKLVVLNMYNISNSLYGLDEFNYGNVASNRQVVVPPTPSYASFQDPDTYTMFPTPGALQWGYFKTTSNQTEVKITWIDNSTSSHTSTITYNNSGTFTIKFQSPKCQIVTSPQNVFIYKFNETSKSWGKDVDASSLIDAASVTASTVWSASIECDRLSAGPRVFYKTTSGYYKSVSNSLSFSPVSFNNNLTLALTDAGQIWNYNHTNKNYSLAYTIPNSANLPEKKIYGQENRIFVTVKNISRLQAWAFNVKPDGNFSTCLNYTLEANAAVIEVSPDVSKFLVLAPASSAFSADMFFIDYQNNTNKAIDFPKPAVFHVDKTYVFLDDRFMYIRQIEQSGVTAEFKESVFFFAQNIVVKPIFTNSYPKDTNDATWVRSIIFTSPQNKNNYLLTQIVNKTASPYARVIKSKEINAQAAELNSNNNALCQSEIVDGKVKLCPRGCSNCDCTSCISGFVYDSSSKACFACAPGCIECDSAVLTKCTSCYPGYFKNSSGNCQPCQSPCLTCSTSATSCSKCPPGQYYSVSLTQCDNCPKNCFNCTTGSACTTCQPGYVLNPNNNACRKCSIKCSSCNPSDITQCTACAKGLQLVSGHCNPCPSNCLSCDSGQCAECFSGYHANSNGVCVLDCKLPCVTCAQNQPTVCLSCQAGSILTSSTCQIDSSCNANHSCTNCGQGLNFYLMPTTSGTGADCLTCPILPNCLQCSSGNTYKCSMCANGYYINQNSDCAACSSICTGCISSIACTGCTAGYTLLDGYSQGQCLQCSSPCATCQGSPTYCTSCVSGFTKKNWMCQNNTYITLKFVVNTDSTNFLSKIDDIIAGLLQILNQTNINVITLNSISSGSIVPTLSISPTSASLSSASTALTAGLVAGIPGTGLTVSGVQVVQNGLTADNVNNKNGPNIALIVGLTVGLTLLVVGIIVTIVLVKKYKATSQVLTEQSFGPVQSRQDISVVEHNKNEGVELKDTIDVDLHFAKQL